MELVTGVLDPHLSYAGEPARGWDLDARDRAVFASRVVCKITNLAVRGGVAQPVQPCARLFYETASID